MQLETALSLIVQMATANTEFVLLFPGGVSGRESICQCRRLKRLGFGAWVRKIPWRRKWQPSPVRTRGKRALSLCLGNPMNRGALWATVHGVAKESDLT